MSIHIRDLVAGQELQGWMRLGLPLKKGRHADGTVFRFVHWKPSISDVWDITKFVGTVVKNDPVLQILTVNAQGTSSRGQHKPSDEPALANIPYSALQILRVLSPAHFPAKTKNTIHPTNQQFNYVPYRTTVNVDLR